MNIDKKLLKLEYRMYGLVPYNISPIQQGIQFGHAVVDYGRSVKSNKKYEAIYNKWADKDKTFIILNGGTTNNNPNKLGTLNSHLKNFNTFKMHVQDFYEPDLGDQLTAICFLIDERIWDKINYPDPDPRALEELLRHKELIGGDENYRLRTLVSSFRLA